APPLPPPPERDRPAAPPPTSVASRTAVVEPPTANIATAPVYDPGPVLQSNSAPRATLQDAGIDETPSSDEDEDGLHRLALTFSAARAVASLYEVTAEVRLGERIGLAALGRLGSLDAKHPSYPQTIHLSGRELGAQARVYVIGSLDHGL